MVSKAGRQQLEKLAEIIGDVFGVADDDGTVLFSGTEDIPEGSSIEIPGSDSADGMIAEDFVRGTRYSFLRYAINDEEIFWFFIGKSESEPRKLLELIVCAYDNKEDSDRRKALEFFRSLMIGGTDSVSAVDMSYYSSVRNALTGYAVIVIVNEKKKNIISNDTEAGVALLEGIFPSRQGFYVVPVEVGKTAVVCPLHEGFSFDDVVSQAILVKDTVRSEIMMNVGVAVGTVVDSIRNLPLAYKTAERAELVGNVFELQEKCFIYDRLGVYRLIYGLSADSCMTYMKEVLGTEFLKERFNKLKNNTRDELLTTIKLFLGNNQNISETSRALYVHRNTLIYRIDKFNKMTNRDCTGFEDGMLIGIALLIMQYYMKMFPDRVEAEFV
ncbi:MAG: helix-turn-helix domain-containing protein [Clostridia bacterium]|nr:helix-turn-helix domain-containing protein [Clostridia bacterium]